MHPLLAFVPGPVTPEALLQATLLVGGFLFLLFAGTRWLPGPVRAGAPLADGSRRQYKLTGLVLFLGTALLIGGGTILFGLSLAPLLTLFWSLLIVANGFAFLWTALLYLHGWRQRQARMVSGEPGPGPLAMLRDLWLGVELNPTWLGVDLKVFAYQPSLIGLALLNAAFAYQQYATYGRLSTPMLLYQAFWGLYVLSYFSYEELVLTMWDVIAEPFGFMLVWGDLVLVPFFYSIGGWFLLRQPQPMSAFAVTGMVLLFLVGMVLLRGANAQKHRFKTNPQVRIWGKPAQTLEGKLLISGWWGIGRKLNYTGDSCIYLAIALTTGFASPVPYLLPLWLTSLLVQRAARDDRRCRAKYGALWEDYCAIARFRMVPFLY
jgi:Delta14-sterol reductase